MMTKELQHLKRALTKCKYPKWALDKVESKLLNNSQEDSTTQVEPSEENTSNPTRNTTGRNSNKDKHSKGQIDNPFTQALGESIKKTLQQIWYPDPF